MYAVLSNVCCAQKCLKTNDWPDQGRIQDFWKGGFICINVWGFALLIFSFLFNIPFGLAETKLFHFHRKFKNEGQGGGFNRIP